MGYRQWIYANEGATVGLQYRAINEVIGIGAITDDEGLPLFGTRASYAMALTILRSAYPSDRSHSGRSWTTIARQIVWGFN